LKEIFTGGATTGGGAGASAGAGALETLEAGASQAAKKPVTIRPSAARVRERFFIGEAKRRRLGNSFKTHRHPSTVFTGTG
jgi:hypothetical protein